MDLRRELRLETDQQVTVTVLDETGTKLLGRIVNLSGRGLRLRLSRPIPTGAAVQVEGNDSLFLGEVCYCHPEAKGFAVGLQLDQALYQLREMASLSERIMGVSFRRDPNSRAPGK